MLLASRLQFLAYFCLINEVFMGELVKTPDGNGWFITGMVEDVEDLPK